MCRSIDSEEKIPPTMSPVCVRTLLGHRGLPLSIRCLSSLVRTSQEPVRFIIHEDGSLTEEDEAQLHEKLPIDSIIWRKEADARLADLLSKYPTCRTFRNDNNVMALKLFDVALLGQSDLYYCDSDILFLLPHVGLYQSALGHADCIFMRDIRNGYSVRPWETWPFTKLRLLSKINAGLMSLRSGSFDLEFIEHFLSKHWGSRGFVKRPQWIEQTCWSAMATRMRSKIYDSDQIVLASPSLPHDSSKIIAIHFVSTFRGMIDRFDDAGPEVLTKKTVQQVRYNDCRGASAVAIFVSDFFGRFGRFA